MDSIQDQKLKDILLATKDLFWKYGFKRVSIEEICKEANVSKMTFYKHFKNKSELIDFILDKVIGRSLNEFRELVDSDLSFQEKVKQMFIIKQNATKGISAEFVNDLYKNPELGHHKKMEEMSKQSMGIFIQFLEDSKKKNLIRKEVDNNIILSFMNTVSQMIENKHIMSKYEKVEDFIMESMNFCFYGIMPRQNG